MTDTLGTVHLLWTGGWDSTYRLLYLLAEGKQVQPHYIVDPERPSSNYELRAIETIIEKISVKPKKFPGTLLPTEIYRKTHVVKNREIEDAYNDILKKKYIGDQYMWLADYCKTRRIEEMEIGVEKNPVFLKEIESGGYPYSEIFGKFRFPILGTSKLEMKGWAEATGTLPIMELTWFCHWPTVDAQPCGRCHPCEVTMEGGMDYRLPLKSRIRYHIRIVPRLRSFVKTFPSFYYALYNLKHKK